MAKVIIDAGIKYTLLDDYHFFNAGIDEEHLNGYYHIKEETRAMAVFPIRKKLRYLIPFAKPRQSIEYLKNIVKENQSPAVTIVDDGEKFGLWPGTYKWVYRRKWLEKFFQLILENKAWLKTSNISEHMEKYKSLGECHLPQSSYEEMMSWCGGNFENYFSKYPEANNLHKRMLFVSEQLERAKSENSGAKKHLYLAQCNCPYWHAGYLEAFTLLD